MSDDIVALFSDLPLEDEYWHRNAGEDYLFSFNIRECRLHLVFPVLEGLARVKTQDRVLEEWYDLEVDITIRFETDTRRIDVVEIRSGNLKHWKQVRCGRRARIPAPKERFSR